MSICCAAAQLVIGIVAAVNDRSRSDTGELSRERYYLRNDIYYERNDPFIYLYPYYCTGSEGAFTWVSQCIIVVILEIMLAQQVFSHIIIIIMLYDCIIS